MKFFAAILLGLAIAMIAIITGASVDTAWIIIAILIAGGVVGSE